MKKPIGKLAAIGLAALGAAASVRAEVSLTPAYTEVPRVVSAPRSGFALVLCGFPLLRGRKVRSVHWERRLSQQDAFAESRSKILRWWSLGSVSMTIGTPPTVMVARAIVPSTAMIPRQS